MKQPKKDIKKKEEKSDSKKASKKVDENVLKEDRIDWLRNQAIIQNAYIELIQRLHRCPTNLEVSEKVNLSIHTIKNHVKELKFEPLQSPLRSLTPDVIISIYNSARKGLSASQKLWMQIMEGWSENMNVNISGTIEERIRNMTEENRLKRIGELKKKINA